MTKPTNPNTPHILVEVKTHYGRDYIYPKNDAAQHFADIAGRKTLYASDLRHIAALGFEIRQHNNLLKWEIKP